MYLFRFLNFRKFTEIGKIGNRRTPETGTWFPEWGTRFPEWGTLFPKWGIRFLERGATFLSCEFELSGKDSFDAPKKRQAQSR